MSENVELVDQSKHLTYYLSCSTIAFQMNYLCAQNTPGKNPSHKLMPQVLDPSVEL